MGTGLSITIVMILAIVFYIRIANIYPESGRNRLLTIEYAKTITAEGYTGNSNLSLEFIKSCIYPLQTAEAVSAVYGGWENNFVQPDNSDEQIPTIAKYVDTGFWKVFDFSFLEGTSFTEADMQSGIRTVVISASFAQQVFGTTDVVGKYISLDFDLYRICGVVKNLSYVADKTFAQLWIPYTVHPDIENSGFNEAYGNTLGNFSGYILSPSVKDMNKVKNEIQENLNKYSTSLGEIKFTVNGQPDRQWQTIFRFYGGQTINFTNIILRYVLIFLVLLLVPAISLSGMADSQMERRLAEMGVRRVFGAPRRTLMNQLISENLLFTLLGGIAGLLLSYAIIYLFRDWIIHIGIKQVFVDALPEGIDVGLTPSMLMNYTVFGITLGICLVLNLLVVIIPAWRVSRREIIYSLNTK